MLNSKSPKNKTIKISKEEKSLLEQKLFVELPSAKLVEPLVGTINGDCLKWAKKLPDSFVDLLFLDPPYNLNKKFHSYKFNRLDVQEYTKYLDEILSGLLPLLKPTASIYICGDWFSSVSIYEVASKYFIPRNRITWEREKGRGSKNNWKNSSEDIWFCTLSNDYIFNLDAVKLRRKVIAPYKENDLPKDWEKTEKGNFRDTHPSNIWTDITIPFWSMPENTAHPTQKSEKLLAKIILSSTNKGDFILDPFLGSGTTSVVAKKLGRNYLGIEMNKDYCLLAEKRLLMAENNNKIQGFTEGVFWERNTSSIQYK